MALPQFRKEVTQAQRENAAMFGDVFLGSPLHHRLYAALGAGIGIGLVLLLVFGQYSRRISVPGQLLPEQGVIRLSAQATGTVVAAQVAEGAEVGAGATLFRLANHRYGSDGGDANVGLAAAITARRDALARELQSTQGIQASEAAALRQRLAGLARQQETLRRQHALAIERQKLTRQALDKFRKLAETGYVSGEQLLQKEGTLLEQVQVAVALETQLEELAQQIDSARKEQSAMPLKHANARSALSRSYDEVRQELVEQEAYRGAAIVAPVAGKVTAIMAKPGGVVAPGQLVATLIPAGARLQANLYVPSHGIGFVRPGARVYLRYRAFPYQKFGQAAGTIVDISATSIRPDELDNSIKAAELTAVNNNEPLYRVRVALDSQQVQADGRAIALLAGGLLDADIVLDRKPLYQWIFDPIGKFTRSMSL